MITMKIDTINPYVVKIIITARKHDSINQISKRLGISVGSAFKILKGLEERGIVLPLNLGNAKFYKLNLENEETTRLCEFLLIEERKLARGFLRFPKSRNERRRVEESLLTACC